MPQLLMSLLGFWKGSWAVSNPHYLLMAEVRLCLLGLGDAVPVAGRVGLCWLLVEPLSAPGHSSGWILSLGQDVINVSLGAVCPKHQPSVCCLCNRGRAAM